MTSVAPTCPPAGTVAGSGPLAGLRVLELAGIGPGPFACMVLADLGADVIRVAAPRPTGVGTQQVSGAVLNRSRVEVVLDLKGNHGRQELLCLVDRADVLIEGYRPGVTERLGVDPGVCLTRNPRLVYVRATGWGQTGTLTHDHGHDINYLALSGTLDMLGRSGQPPTPPVNLLGDFGGGGMLVALGALAGVHSARQTGHGQVVDASILDGATLVASMVHAMIAASRWNGERGTNIFDTGAPYYEVYQTADARWMAVGATSTTAFRSLCAILGLATQDLPPMADRAGWPTLRARLAEAFRSRPQSEWAELFEHTPACVTPVLTFAEAIEHHHNAEHGTFVTVDGIPQAAPAPRFSRTPTAPPHPLLTGERAREAALARWRVNPPELPGLAGRPSSATAPTAGH